MSPAVTVGVEIRVAIRDLDDDGAGVGAVGAGAASAGDPSDTSASTAARDAESDVEVHVPGALPGEDVSARVEHVSIHRPIAWAHLTTIHRSSSARVPAACPAHGRCGGCVLQHFDYGAQVAWKERHLRLLVAASAAAAPALAGVAVTPAVPSPAPLGYRNNAKLVAARDRAGALVLGAYAPRSHDVVDLGGCAIGEPPLDPVAADLRAILDAHAVEPYDERRLTGTLRYVILRASAAGDVLATLVTATDAFPAGAAIAAALRARRPNVVGVIQNVNPSRGNALFGAHERTLAGAAMIEDRIGGVRLRVSSRAFFQANRQVAAAAYAEIARAVALTGTERVVDAYAGVGGIALTLAPGARTVVGIEEHPAAVDDATASAALNGVTNARFVAGDVAVALADVAADGAGADVVILNPPRKGCARAVLNRVAALAPRTIAYLSCAPETLLRDLAILDGLGYRTSSITPFDMLPHTPHLEALAIAERTR